MQQHRNCIGMTGVDHRRWAIVTVPSTTGFVRTVPSRNWLTKSLRMFGAHWIRALRRKYDPTIKE
jgi:hypothetical protein